ncbi:TPA: EamA family transporter [bacterium]|nr:EamA family transporter [bacterium]
MWLLYALGAAFFAGITSILAKIGIKNTDSTIATAIRTIIVLLFAWLMVLIVGSYSTISEISSKSLLFLALSGLATGGSWLCYFKALQLGDVNKVVPIDKSSTVLTMILAIIFLGEEFTLLKGISMVVLLVGTLLLIERKDIRNNKNIKGSWLFFAILSAVFASLTAILGKVGISGVESNLGTALRTIVVLFMSWIMVFVVRKQGEIKSINRIELLFILLSGLATGASWLFYYKALQLGEASVVVPIDKLSIVITILFTVFILKEKISKKSILGLILIVAGTILLLI